jgi:4-hydroxyphenylpyruvate dioxygenase
LSGDEVEVNAHIKKHGDGARDVAFTVDDARGIHAKAISRGATSVQEPTELTDERGTVIIASIRTYGDTIHSFVQRNDFTGDFLPGFRDATGNDPINAMFPEMNLLHIDHCVGNQPDM